MRDNITPEEKLLKLIRNPKKHEASSAKLNLGASRAEGPASIPQLKTGLKLGAFDYKSLLSPNRIMLYLLILAALYLLFSFIYPFIAYKKITIDTTNSTSPVLETQEKTQVKPYDEYIKDVGNKEIFSAQAAASVEPAAAAVNSDAIKDINLVGIISGDNPQAVIEDKKTQKTYYLFKGQAIGEFQVEDIKEGKIIINYRGQKFELYL